MGKYEKAIKEQKKSLKFVKETEELLIRARNKNGENLLHLHHKQLKNCKTNDEVVKLAKKHEGIRRRGFNARLSLSPDNEGTTPRDAFSNHLKHECFQEGGDRNACFRAAGYRQLVDYGN